MPCAISNVRFWSELFEIRFGMESVQPLLTLMRALVESEVSKWFDEINTKNFVKMMLIHLSSGWKNIYLSYLVTDFFLTTSGSWKRTIDTIIVDVTLMFLNFSLTDISHQATVSSKKRSTFGDCIMFENWFRNSQIVLDESHCLIDRMMSYWTGNFDSIR